MTTQRTTARTVASLLLGLALAAGGCALAGDVGSQRPSRTNLQSGAEDVDEPVEGAEGDFAVAEASGPVLDTRVETPWGALPFKYRMVDGDAIAEGDIVLPVGTMSATSVGRQWHKAVVPYVIDANLPLADRVTSAIAHWEEKTKLRFVPRTTERDYLHFRSASSCSSFIGQQGGRQFVNLTTAEGPTSVGAIGIDRSVSPQRVYWFFKRGFATTGSLTRANALSPHFRYIVAPGKSAANLVDVAFASNGHLFAWYDDGTVSEGTREDFTQHAPAKPYVLAPGKTPADVAAFTLDTDDRAHVFYTDGTFSSGTVTDLAATPPQPFTVAAERTTEDLVQVAVGADGTFHAWYTETTPHPDGGAPVVRALWTSSGTASNLGSSGGTPARASFPGHCGLGATIHEIGHAIGFFHEQTRHDRDQHVTIMWENVSPDQRFNFEKHSRIVGNDIGPYDFGSIMHYGPKAFTANGEDTIVMVDGGTFTEQRDGLSPGDIAGAAAMYP